MFPVLLAIGPFELRTLSVISVLAFLVMAFVFWRKGREEHYELGEYFDGFILATISGFLAGRVAFVALNWGQFGWQFLKYLDIVSYPGSNTVIALTAATLFLYQFAAKRKWDEFEVLDFWVLAVANGTLLTQLGLFLDGSSFGTVTELPVGVMFPGTQELRHPVQLYTAAFFMILAWYLSQVEYRFRTFEWYRGGKKNAKSGFLFAVFLLGVSTWFFATSWVNQPIFLIGGINWDRIGTAVGFALGVVFLLRRSGRLEGRRKTAVKVAEKSDETV